MPSPLKLRGGARHMRSRSLSAPVSTCVYSTLMQSRDATHITNAPSSPPPSTTATTTNNTLNSPLGKASCVQQMWFQGSPRNPRLSKDELSRNIAAMLEDESQHGLRRLRHTPHGAASNTPENAMDASPNITLLVGEVLHSAPDPQNEEIQVNRIRLSNVCSPRTVLSGRMQTPAAGKKVVVAVVNNLSLRHSRGTFSEGVLLRDHAGALLSPGDGSRVGGKVNLVGNGQILNHLYFPDNGFANFCHGELLSEEGHVISRGGS